MVQINFAQKTVNVKVVYYGPGMSGKTTNLEVVHQRAPNTNRGELTSISTDGDRTLFFDYMPLELGTVAGMRTSFQIYTVPGQVYYNSTRKLVLQGVDGVIFVADSASSMLDQNLESLRNLEENLNEYGKSLATLPHVVQWNKRDLPDAMTTEELNRLLNAHKAPDFEAIANSGQGVFPTLKALAALVLKNIMKDAGGGSPSAPAPITASAAPSVAAAPTSSAPAAPVGSGLAQPAGAAPALQVAQPVAPAQNSASHLMQSAPAQAPAAPMAAPQHQRAHVAASQRPTAARHKERTTSPAPRKKKSGALTGVFVVAAAGVGAALAWFLLSTL